MDLDALAHRQYGLITRVQAKSAGLTDDAIRHRVASGRWVRRRSGLYALAGARESWRQEILGCVLVARGDAWASHASAARLWGFAGFAESPVEVTVPLGRAADTTGVRTHRSGTLQAPDLREVDGIPTLSAARTVADLSSRLELAVLGRFVDDGLRRGVLSLRALDRVVRHLHQMAPGRSPKKLTALLVDRVSGYHPGGSELETWVARCLIDAGLPAPVRQHKVMVDGRTYYLDLAYPEHRLAIEVDGFDFHRTRDVFDADRVRQNDLVRAGWTVLRFTSRSTAEEIVAAVRDLVFDGSSGP